MKLYKQLLITLTLGLSLMVIGCTDSDGVPTPPEPRPFSADDCPLGVWDGWCDVAE